MPNGKDPVMEAMKTASRHRLFNGRMRVAEAPKLPNRDHAMLATGQSCQFLPPWQRFSIHKREKLCRG